ncbi:unnamed protein product [Spirodela intermedia]|uniref:Uncharacterized protein n=1 Tax=Spirodela intermedia TaxID=51605 RepID=A0A7I8JTU9_SPIIN|nr:unnamed protein product [Spirodela intermedia]CAA6673606.1 unnamed protein product [Spirodela intermedia]
MGPSSNGPHLSLSPSPSHPSPPAVEPMQTRKPKRWKRARYEGCSRRQVRRKAKMAVKNGVVAPTAWLKETGM